MAFTLADASPGTLEVLDVFGRRVLGREVGELGAGRHVIPLESTRTLSSGVYLIRLRRGGQAMVVRGVVIE